MGLHTAPVFEKYFLDLYPNTVYLKFRFSKKATKFETISHVIWRLLRKCQIKWEIVSNFCGLFRMSEFYVLLLIFLKSWIYRKNARFLDSFLKIIFSPQFILVAFFSECFDIQKNVENTVRLRIFSVIFFLFLSNKIAEYWCRK